MHICLKIVLSKREMNMNVNEQIVEYLSCDDVDERDVKSSADLLLQLNGTCGVNRDELYQINSTHHFINMIESKRICSNFDFANIKYIIFKGNVLATLLYEKKEFRMVGDIDIYVWDADFDLALSILYSLGFSLHTPQALLGEHHVVLENDKVVLELHKHIINPRIGIDENYLLCHIKKLKISGSEMTTFDITATFLHLLYHLYMDSCLSYNSLYSIFINRKIPRANRFLYARLFICT